jgi:DNA replication and repair protein RecF
MWLEYVRLSSVRAYGGAEMELPAGLSVLTGPNGEGKTTILEAVGYLLTLRSFRTARRRDLVRTGDSEAVLAGRLHDPDISLQVTLEPGGRRLGRAGESVPSAAGYCRDLNAVALAPEHEGVISGGPEERRRYLDRALFGSTPFFLEPSQRYQRALKHKQALLRNRLSWPSYRAQVAPWDEELSRYGEEIRKGRRELTARLLPEFARYYVALACAGDIVDLSYRDSPVPLTEEFHRRGREEHGSGRALVGPHRDDLGILLRGRPAAEVASQGEKASLLLALKLAEIHVISTGSEGMPILLLDDLGSTLDTERRKRLLEFVRDRPFQALVTTTDPALVAALREIGGREFCRKNEEKKEGFSFARWVPAW